MGKVIEKKPMLISTNLQVEWGSRLSFNGGGACKMEELVQLIEPQNEQHARDFVMGLMPRSALKLLAWLEQERETLEALVSEQREVN